MYNKMYNKLYSQVIKWNTKNSKLPILKEMRAKNHKLQATDLEVWIETPIDLTDRMLDPVFLDGYDGTTASDPNDFPDLKLPKVIQEIELGADAMANILWCARFVSKDQTRPVLTGVAMTSKGCVYGTDGYKMARRHYFNHITPDHITLPAHLLTLLKLAKADKSNWTMTIYGNNGEPDMVAFKSGDLTIYSRLIDGNIPLYDPLLDNIEYTHKITIPKGMKIPKGYAAMVEMRDEVANHSAGHGQVYLQSDDRRVLATDIKIEPATLTDENPVNVDVVMKMVGTPFGIDPGLLKAWKNKSIELYFNNKTNTVMVKEV